MVCMYFTCYACVTCMHVVHWAWACMCYLVMLSCMCIFPCMVCKLLVVAACLSGLRHYYAILCFETEIGFWITIVHLYLHGIPPTARRILYEIHSLLSGELRKPLSVAFCSMEILGLWVVAAKTSFLPHTPVWLLSVNHTNYDLFYSFLINEMKE